MPTKEEIIEALKKVSDPEIQIDVWTMGLIYDLQIHKDGRVLIKATLTSPSCPYAPQLLGEMKRKVEEVKGVNKVEIELTFDPPWKPTEELKALLGIQ